MASTRKRPYSRSWQRESVGGTSRRRTLGKLATEIAFAFRAPSPTDEPLATTDRSLAGEYLAVLAGGTRNVPLKRDDKDTERLEWELHDIKHQVQRLAELKRALETRRLFRSVATRDAVFRVTDAYFRMFRDGFEIGPRAQQHEAFLRSVADRDVVMCTQMHGVDALVEQWRRYDEYFELRDYRLRSIHATAMDSTPILQIECGYHVFVTQRTIKELFPHILGDPYLVQKIIGKKLECDSRVTFVFGEDAKIVRYDDHSDFVAAFGRLLRNTRDLERLMNGALITEHSLIGDLEQTTASVGREGVSKA